LTPSGGEESAERRIPRIPDVFFDVFVNPPRETNRDSSIDFIDRFYRPNFVSRGSRSLIAARLFGTLPKRQGGRRKIWWKQPEPRERRRALRSREFINYEYLSALYVPLRRRRRRRRRRCRASGYFAALRCNNVAQREGAGTGDGGRGGGEGVLRKQAGIRR